MIVKTLLLIATAAPLTAAHTLLRGNLPTEQYITSYSLLDTSWTATDIYYADDDELKPVLADTPATLIFSNDSTVSGYAGCNQIFGDVVISSSKLEFGEVTQTMMGCFGDVRAQEWAFSSAVFRESVRYKITSTEADDQVLILGDAKTGEVTARFVPLPEPTLVDSDWELNGVIMDDKWGSISHTFTDEPITLSFDETTFKGYTGCNTFQGEWEDVSQEGATYPMFRTNNLVTTKRGCVSPFPMDDEEEHIQAIAEQEQIILDALSQDVVAYSIEQDRGGGLTLYDTTVNDDDTVDVGDRMIIYSTPRSYEDEEDNTWASMD